MLLGGGGGRGPEVTGVGGKSVVRGALPMEEGASLHLHGGSRSGRQNAGL